MYDEQYLIDECRKGNKLAWEKLYKHWSSYCYTILQRYGISQEDMPDLMQETFVQVFLNLNKFNKQKGEFKYWLRRLTINKALMHLRKLRAQQKVKIIDIEDANTIPDKETLGMESLSKTQIMEIIKSMPECLRLVFNLSIFDGYNHKEISEALDITEQNSRTRLNRAKVWLRKSVTVKQTLTAYGL